MARRSRLFISMLAIASMLLPLLAVPASAQNGRGRTPSPTLLSDTRQAWVMGTSQWVNFTWTTDADIEDLRVTGTSSHQDVSIGYSTTTGDHAGPSENADLSANEIDHTAIHITTGERTPSNFNVRLTATWKVDGESYSGRTTIRFRGAAYEGDAFAVLTDVVDVSIADGASSWVDLNYTGLAPSTTDFSVTASGSDVEIYHPQVDFTSLHHDAVLVVGETDTARIWLDPDVVQPGTYDITVRITYSTGGSRDTLEHPVRLNVSG